MPQLDGVPNLGIPLVLYGKSIDTPLEALYQHLGCGQFRQVAKGVRIIEFDLSVK